MVMREEEDRERIDSEKRESGGSARRNQKKRHSVSPVKAQKRHYS